MVDVVLFMWCVEEENPFMVMVMVMDGAVEILRYS
jgi:hypothetical protein